MPVVSLSRDIPAPAADIFELLARPDQHPVVDGSGSVRGAQPNGPERLSADARFGMTMKIVAPYKILNTVVEFDEGRRIAWRHFGGHVWRWLLEPIDDGRTRVTEQFDPTTSRAPLVLKLISAERRNRRSIVASLDRLEAWAQARG